MKGSVIALGHWQGRKAAARLVDGVLDDLIVDPPDETPRPGAIYKAIAGRAMKGQGGAFVTLPSGARGFLRAAKGSGGAAQAGRARLVQVVSYAEPAKAAPMTDRILFKGRYAIVTPGSPGINVSRQIKDDDRADALRALAHEYAGAAAGIILRSRAGEADDTLVADEIAALAEAATQLMADEGSAASLLLAGPDAHELAWREWPDADLVDDSADAFEAHGVFDAIDAVLSPGVPLGGGAHAFIEPTRALVAVDVNTGGDTSAAAGLKANIALCRALPRGLRCRGLGGQITVDFAPMPKRDRRQVEGALRAAFRSDPVETALVGWTPLGHFELQRKRERAPLKWSLSDAPAAGKKT
ncbi:MAG: ribonuclease E/G [Pseudomonadota bacterium]